MDESGQGQDLLAESDVDDHQQAQDGRDDGLRRGSPLRIGTQQEQAQALMKDNPEVKNLVTDFGLDI